MPTRRYTGTPSYCRRTAKARYVAAMYELVWRLHAWVSRQIRDRVAGHFHGQEVNDGVRELQEKDEDCLSGD